MPFEKKGGSTVQSLQDNLRNLENGLKHLKTGGASSQSKLKPQSKPQSSFRRQPSVKAQSSVPRSPRDKQINLIMDWVQKVAGIKPDKRVYIKLEQLFKQKSVSQVEQLINQINLQENSTEAHKLLDVIEKLTVHETFFFREIEQLQIIQQDILPQIIQQQKGLPFPSIRILSAACSTGEEVYSLAILAIEALKKEGLVQIVGDELRIKAPWSLSITGIDISRRAIKIGQGGKYDCHNDVDSLNCKSCLGQLCSFRSMPQQFFDFFTLHKNPHSKLEKAYAEIKPAIKRLVNFKVHNLTSPLAENNYNAIICRNVLIYFDNEKKTQAQNVLHKALSPSGLLLLGSADTLLIPEKFNLKRSKYSVYFQKKVQE